MEPLSALQHFLRYIPYHWVAVNRENHFHIWKLINYIYQSLINITHTAAPVFAAMGGNQDNTPIEVYALQFLAKSILWLHRLQQSIDHRVARDPDLEGRRRLRQQIIAGGIRRSKV